MRLAPPFVQHGGILPWLAAGGVLLAAVVTGGVLGYWLFLNLALGLKLKDQPAAITLPPQLDVTAQVTNIIEIGMQGDIRAEVPFDRQVIVPLRGEYDLDIALDAQVPVAFEVVYEGVIPVDTVATIQARTTLDFKTIKQYRDLKIEAELPLKFNLPVKLRVPVNDTLRFKYRGPITAALNQNLETHLDTVLRPVLPVDQTVTAPVTRSFGLQVNVPQRPLRARIDRADLNVDLDTLRLELAEDSSQPERMAVPYGPAAR